MLTFTIIMYHDYTSSKSSTAGLIFLIGPIFLLVGGPIVFGLVLAVHLGICRLLIRLH